MTTKPDFKLERCIYLWTTQAPNTFVQTEYFIFQNSQCNFFLDIIHMNRYRLFIYCNSQPSASFYVTVHLLNGSDISYPTKIVEAKGSTSTSIWESDQSEIVKLVPDFQQRRLLSFRIVFHESSNFSPDQVKTESKAVQTPLYLNNTLWLESLSQDFSKLMDGERGTDHDVVLKCGDHTLQADRVVLGTRSEVFQAMLRSDMLEGRTGQVDIQDMDETVFKDFIRYLYTGKILELTVDKATNLYKAGDKYAVKSLVQLCASYLSDHLTPANACDCLVLAEAHSDKDLKEKVIAYILDKNISVAGENWQSFCADHPVLANEVLNRVCMSLQSKLNSVSKD